MIASLAREQLRSQRRYVAWAGAVISLAVGMAVYGMLLATSLAAASDAADHALVHDTEFLAQGMVTEHEYDVDIALVSSVDIAQAVTEAQAEGTRAGAQASLWSVGLELPGPDGSSSGMVPLPTAAIGDIAWDDLLIEGHEPQRGQIAVSAAYAQQLAIGLGDAVPLYSSSLAELPGVRPDVVGITRSSVNSAGLWLGLPDVWLAWEDLPSYESALIAGGDPDLGAAADVTITWDGASEPLSSVFGAPAVAEGMLAGSPSNSATIWIVLGTVSLVVGAVAMAFAFGRAQAQSRTQWVATARALGASRRHIVAATGVEAGILSAIGALGGLALGWAITAIHLALVHINVPAAAMPALPVWSGPAVVAALVLALVLALVVAGVPAFWATRVSPTAALKPENDITASEVGRRVAFWPVAGVWAATGAAAAIGADPSQTDGGPLWSVMLSWLFVITSVIVGNEFLRWAMPKLGARLSRSARLPVLVAGDTISARPRQFSVPALLIAIGSGGLLAVATLEICGLAGQGFSEADFAQRNVLDYVWPSWIAPATVVVMGTLGVLTTIIAVATTTVTSRERATREALGASARQTRAAAGIAHFATLAVGMLAGFALAAAVVTVWLAFMQLGSPDAPMSWEVAIPLMLGAAGLIAGVALVVVSVGALVVAAAARTPGVPGLPSASTGEKQGVSR